MKRPELIILPVAVLVVGALTYYGYRQHASREAVPDFSAIKNIAARKQRFFAFLLPKVRYANARVHRERELILRFAHKIRAGQTLSKRESATLLWLVSRYDIDAPKSPASAISALLRHVDTVPASLMLAQAATESAWGTSRFARDGNNFFGIWCFTPGCGMTPKARSEHLTHEVARFDSVQTSVNRYLHTINTNIAYDALRALRARLRREHKPVRGIVLARGLRHYSQRREEYVRYIQDMIRSNHLQRFTQPRNGQVSAHP